ncbi:hypothetical protein E8E11_004701 [Didymella keratinophila]|nr:hypothetical protein E8E11_004701 [Didymella keratinophila]
MSPIAESAATDEPERTLQDAPLQGEDEDTEWGDVLTYGWGPSNGYAQKLNDDSVAGAWRGIFKLSDYMLLDTAEHYGYTDGYSKSTLVFATKFFPTPRRHPWRNPGITLQSASGSLERDEVGKVDVYQWHGPSHWGSWPKLDILCEALAQAYTAGKVKVIGTCNLSLEQITTIAYSPLAVGRLTGKYSQQNLPRGNRNFGHVKWAKLDSIVEELKRIGEKHRKTPTAVALNWVVCKGAIPIPTPKNKEQVDDCLQALGWRLSQTEEDRLDALGLTNA